MDNTDDKKWKQDFALREQEFCLSQDALGVSPPSSGSGYALRILARDGLRVLRYYPSRKKNPPKGKH